MNSFFRQINFAKIYQDHTQKLFQVISQNNSQQNLMSILAQHKQMIEKLLENQNSLTYTFENIMRSQTTDTQNNGMDTEQIFEIKNPNYKINEIKTNKILFPFYAEAISSDSYRPTKKIEIFSQFLDDKNIQYISSQEDNNDKQHQGQNYKKSKICETKNLVKNFGKSILTFIRKNKTLKIKVLQHFGVTQNQFNKEFKRFEINLNTLNDLKAFWTDNGNSYAKVFRSLSNIYLKKYNLKHTFSSRVKNTGIHIKYRKRLLQILQNPQQFSQMKTF